MLPAHSGPQRAAGEGAAGASPPEADLLVTLEC